MPRRRQRSTLTGLLVVAAVAVVGGFFVTDHLDGGTDPIRPVAASATTSTDSGVVVIDRSGPDLPGAGVLDRCSSDPRAAVQQYDTEALGDVVLQCGTSAQGYEHIRVRHTTDWQDVLRGHGDRDWDDAMLTAVQAVLTDPQPGFPVDVGDGKVCYAAPVRFDDGSTPSPDGYATVIVSATTLRVITAYPTDDTAC